jgi:hypothetical protein
MSINFHSETVCGKTHAHFIDININKINFRKSIYNWIHNDVLALPDWFYSINSIVPDVCRYTVDIDKTGNIKVSPHNKTDFPASFFYDLKPSNITKSIVSILESPHSDEYGLCLDDKGNLKRLCPIAPAQGDTGTPIDLNLRYVLVEIQKKLTQKKKLAIGSYNLIIVNPVPYQTSLGSLYKGLNEPIRNAIWQALWNIDAVRNDFFNRLDSYSPSLIINACTGGKDPRGLKSRVQKEILKHYPYNNQNPVIVKTYHPAINWSNSKYGIEV